jgi:hypothetical protein
MSYSYDNESNMSTSVGSHVRRMSLECRFSNKMTNFSQECRMGGESVTKLRK